MNFGHPRLSQAVERLSVVHPGSNSTSFLLRLQGILSAAARDSKIASFNLDMLATAVELVTRFRQQNDQYEALLTATRSGYLELEWRSPSRLLSLEATEPGWYLVGTLILATGVRRYHDGECTPFDIEFLDQAWRWFLGETLQWPTNPWIQKGEKRESLESEKVLKNVWMK